MRNVTLALLAATTALVAAPAYAVTIPDGTVSVSNLFVPTVTLGANSGTFSVSNGLTFQTAADGGFAGAAGGFGTVNGSVSFSNTIGQTVVQTLPNFFTFGNGGSSFQFSATSALTQAYNVVPGVTTSVALYLLGNTIGGGFDPTPTSFTLTFNSTGGSAFSSSATLSVPPTPMGDVPEPASWAMMLGGFGLMGYGLRNQRRRKVSYSIG